LSNDVMSGAPGLAWPHSFADEGGAGEVRPTVSLLHQAFELRAAAEPHGVALVVGEDRLTCGELDARANRLARFLIEQGVGPEVRVAICAERTAEMVVAMYAVLKAGGAYVPVDPAYPEARQADILADSGALLLLTQEHLAERIPRTSAKPVFLDREGPRIDRHGAGPLVPRAGGHNLAYVIYTSGSTGRPKGVAIEHRCTMSLIRWAAATYSPEEISGVLAATSVCFDLSIFELFVTLALGGTAILADNALSLPALPAAGEVTLVNTVPSAVAELLRSGGIPPFVRTLNLAGEALRGALVQRLYRELGSLQKIYNLYGPSEDTTYSTCALMERGDARIPSIGLPLEGTSAYVLSPDLERVPAGEPGELYLGGEGLARGYLSRPDLTALRFVPDPHSPRPGERIYATGDLVRYRQDGALDYLGRTDHQVKIRGFRVELGEIEAALGRHPGVGDTVVVARDLAAGGESADRSLVAYVVPRAGADPALADLRDHLRRRLADYMVPAHFVILPSLPLNPNGKVDRAALPAPESAAERPAPVAPRTPLEASLAAIWAEILQVGDVGVDDDFFALGGHSLLAARVIARIHEVLERRLPPRALFEAPTVERLAARLAELPAGEELAGIPVARERGWTPSAGQEAMWFSDRLSSGIALFTIPLLLELSGPLDRPALLRSLAAVVRRHEVLRVVFREVNGRPELTLRDAIVDLPRIDLRSLPPGLRDRQAELAAAVLGRERIDVERGPLLQGYLMELDERDHRLLVAMHHLVADDWSIWVLAHDLALLYAAAAAGRPAGLPAPALRFADYAAWQREWLEGEEARGQLEFWKRHLPVEPEVLDLPIDRPRPAMQSFLGAQWIAAIPLPDSHALFGLALRSRATLFMALLAVLDSLLHRYSGQEDLTVAAPVANRHRTGTQDLIGLFTNSLVLRADFSADPRYDELLRQVRETVIAALGHQDFPFDRLVREMEPERSLGHSPLAQVFLSFQNTPPLPRQLGPGLDLRLHELGNGTAKADITLYIRQQGEALVTVWEYASELFDAATIDRMSAHFQRLLSAVVADPSRRISELPLLTTEEGEQIASWAGDDREAAGDRVHELFAAWAARAPDAPAVRCEGEILSFGEVDARASALARRLLDLGIGPERRVAVCVERSPAMVVAILGILKAGGAYVPLDADVPADRLGFILADCGARVLILQDKLVAALPPFDGVGVEISADGRLPEAAEDLDGTVWTSPPTAAGNLAYVIYTSGSTGRPKGVMVEHRQLASYLDGVRERMALPEGSSFAMVSTIAADLGNTVLFAALVSGGCLHLISPARSSESTALANYFERYPVDCLKIVPSHLAALLASPRAAGCLPQRLLIVGGEAVPPGLVGRIGELAPDCRLLNHYGPTETTVGVLTHEVETRRPLWDRRTRIPLGKPLRGTRVLILDRNLAPVAIGVPGEIHVGGPQVTRGYLDRPALTAGKYIPDPWSGIHASLGSRLYATGDRGRHLPDGAVEFLGRVDFQVKIRGFRVEPGEVETVLRSHPGVGEAVVAARGQRLVAYVVANPEGGGLDGSRLRSFLRERLPDPLVPTAWVFLPALPLTLNGKVDRRALPAPEDPLVNRPAVAPRTPTEGVLASLWADVLGLGGVGIHESFFELGGHSLLAIQVISRVMDSFGVALSLRQFFDLPTIAGLSEVVDTAQDLGQARAVPHIEPVDRGRPLRLSFGQQRLWFLDQLAPGSPVYNLPAPLRIEGSLRMAALARALGEIAARHESLRTTFPAVEGKPVQVIAPATVPLPLPVVDLRGLPEASRKAESARRVEAESRRPFDLAAGPLFRALLIQQGAEEHALVLVMHHIVADGWSHHIVLRELRDLYGALSSGRPAALHPLPVQYADFAAWQRRWFTGARLVAPLEYWRDRLQGTSAVLELPTDRPRPNAPSFRGGLLSHHLSPVLSEHLHRLCRSAGATPHMLMLAALDTLLFRYTGQVDLVVGSAIAGRNRAEIEGLIGFFVNTLVLRVDLADDPSFLVALQRAEQAALAAYEHQDLPFELLVQALHPDRDPARNPFFQVMLNSHRVDPEEHLDCELRMSRLDVDLGTAKFDLILTVLDSEQSLGLAIEYSSDLYDRATAARLLGHLEILLAGAARNPEEPLSALPLLTPAELHQVATEWNDSLTCYPREARLHDLVAEWVIRTPEAVAVVFEESRLTYRELDSRAGLLAAHLRGLGVGPDVFVVVAMERSLDFIVALFAILKAGGAFMPVDPGYPQERIAWLLADSGAPVLVSETRFLERLPPSQARTVLLDDGWESALASAPEGDGEAWMEPAAESIAYMMYTSGTTGRPKGVMVPHRGVVRLVRNNPYARFAGEVFLQISATSFDTSAFEIWGALANGARLVVFPGSRPSLEEIGAVLLRYEVTTLWLTSGLFQQMVEQNLEGLRPVRQLLSGGDVVSAPHVRAVLERFPGVTVIDGYGPTENSTFTTCHAMTDPARIGNSIPVGRPVANTSVHLLDRTFRPVPAGVPGELLTGGDGLARGYHRRPDLTAEKFVPDPTGADPGGRLYRTGDLARFLPDGRVDFLGRIDQQVKIRGFRIELGEIESILADHPAVAQAAVTARAGRGGAADRRLVAYLVAVQKSAPPAASTLRDYLRDRLPDYMVPVTWVFLAALPLSPNGKVDRRALPEPEAARSEKAERAAPRTPTQEVLAGIWAEVLELPAVGIHDNFFDLGGHSLLATQVVSRVRGSLGVELPLRRMFELPTVARFAASIDSELGAGAGPEASRIERAPRTGRLPLSFAQSRLWFLDQLSPGSSVYNIPYPLAIGGALDARALKGALTEVSRRHEALRTIFASVDGEPSQAISPAGPFPLPLIDLQGLPEPARRAEAGALIGCEARRPFDLTTGPLFRTSLLRLERERHVLLLTLHHIVADGWSLEILLRELTSLYAAIAAGRPSPFPELAVQYADFAIWQRQWLTGEALSRQLDYWRRQLAGAPAGLDLPTDLPRPALQTFAGATCSAPLPPELAADLRAFCRAEGVTLFMLLLAGFDVLLGRYSGQEDVLVGSPVANRNREETEGLIGFFVNTLVLRTDLSAAPSFRTLLRQVRESALAAYGHQDLPFETLVEELRPERDLSRSPLFQVLLALRNAGASPGIAGLELVPLAGENATAKFDLSLGVIDSDSNLWSEVEYNTDLFEEGTARRLLGHLGRLLAAAVADPECGWRDLPLLTAEEREQLLVGFNDTGSTFGPEICLHQLFEAQAARVPNQVALVAPDGRLTYRELNDRADRLARLLRSLGLGPEGLAGVLMDRTADLIVTLLAVHKAGGAYAPLDPNYPRQRVLLMLETSRAKVLVTRRRLAEALGGGLPEEVRTVFLDPGWEREPVAEAVELPAEALADNLAYVIFTSGSTGVPKGVAIQHRSAVAMVRWAHAMYSPEEYAGVLASTSICFDMSVFEIFATLAAGGKLLLVENALALPDLEAKGEVVLVDTVPSAMAELLRLGRLPASIRTVNLGGEPLKGSLVGEIYAQLPAVERVVNLYGPSEDTTFTSFSVVPRGAEHPLIGRPLTGERAYVLDAEMRPVPLGIPGALYMGGEGVTRGYLGRPDLTAERYIPNPYGPSGSRLYVVGDLVRYLPTGELDFLGRLDHQVKVRGYRVELGEIESALARHPEVQDAAVLAAPEEGGGNRLIAWVEAARDLPPGELRAFLKASLPDYMVPSAFLTLRELPLTPNGKIDRRVLASADTMPPSSGTASLEERAPRSYAEEVLVGIWSEIFGHAVGVNESFFDLGGHSLLATRVASRVREAFGIELPLRRLFERPTVAALAVSVESALGAGGALQAPPIEPVPRSGSLPLSYAQRRLWFLDQLSPGSAVYNIPHPLEIGGDLDVQVLQAALTEVVRRHESLRTAFPSVDGEPVQAIAPAGPFSLPVLDVEGLDETVRHREATRLVETESLRPFDIGTGPTFRTTLVRLGRERHLLLLTMHHIVADGWSLEILARELMALYEAFAAGLPSPLPELPVQYADFAIWQRRWLTGEALSGQLDYWRRQLAGAPAGLDLPTDYPRPAMQSFDGTTRSAELAANLARDLKAFCRREGVTLFMLLLAGFDVLLARYSGQKDVLVGSPIANRNRAETEGLIGFFVNTLVLRIDLGPAVSFRDVLRQGREAALAAYGHQDLPFEMLVEELRPERDLSRSPFFQVLLSAQTAGRDLPGTHSLQVSEVEAELDSAKFDLSLFVTDSPSSLGMTVEYNTDLFEEGTARRLLGHLGRLLAVAVADPECGWRDLPLLTAEEREQLLVGFNDTGSTFGPEICLHQLFEAQAARVPNQVALVAPDGRLTYRELNDRADRLARLLRSLGLGPEGLAGVLMDRTADLIVTLLAVHKAGGAYAPLDPNYPRQRVLLMLETSRAKVLVTRRRLAEALGGGLPEEVRTVFLDPGWEREPVAEAVELPAEALADNLAYVIFTSGSTGVPKGVAIQHRSAVAMVRWAHAMYSPEEYAGVLASTSICFDMSVFEIFATLAAGGKLLLVENALALPDLEAKGEVVLVDTVPSAMAELLRLGRLPASIRTVNLGGEPLKGSLVGEIYAQLPAVERVVNLYGPSEDTTFTSFSVVPRGAEHPLIGRPLTGERAYVLDAEMRPVPLGIPGALYMGGEGVTRGYLGRPDLTAERYIPNPYGPSGSRLYAVGDLVRYLPTGELDFLGRLDHQVKVRGYRVELGEVEAALARHPEVQDAAVLAAPEEGGGNRLIAWVEAARDLPPGELRAFLKASLPDYMVPSAFLTVRELPLTPNGKIDRRALASADTMPSSSGTLSLEERAPRSYAEEVLAGIWSEIFGHAVGVNENFFDLGGHSLLATRVASRVREAFGIELPLRRLFERPTVAALAVSVESALGAGETLEAPPIEPVPRSGSLPLSYAQRRLWFLDQLSPGSAVYNIPYPLSLEGALDPGILKGALEEIVRRHESLRTTFPIADGEPYQQISPAGPFPLPVADLRGLSEGKRNAQVFELARSEALRPFALDAGPLLRTTLLQLDHGRHVLLLTMHHIVSDGWSMEILLRELMALYEAFAAGRPSPLPELPVQYADFAVWQRRWLSGEALARQVEYWRHQLAGAPAGLDLPTDFQRPAVQTFEGSSRSVQLSAALTADLKALCQREGVTVFMLLLAAFDTLLARYSGQQDILVGSPIANRNRAETEGLIGFFVNTLVLRSDLAAVVSFRALLRQVRETALAAYGHQDLPFETLVEELRPERDLSRSPFFQVMLSHQSVRRDLPGLRDLKLALVEGESETAKFDLGLTAVEAESTLWLAMDYNTDLFEGATAGRFLNHLSRLLEGALASSEGRWTDLPILPEAERAQVLAGFNDTGSTAGADACLHQLFEFQVARAPDRVALVAPEGRLTYRELNARADRLAYRLRLLGLGPEALAGVLMDRTSDLIVSLFAVLKAGGAYVPLDPSYPRQRVLLMLETSRAKVLVTRRGLAEALGDELPAGVSTVFLEPGWEDEVVEERVIGQPPALADNLAYVIFTSGSTGVPKGVAIQHRSAVAMVRWARTVYSPEEYGGVLASTSVCFDMSVFEIFATLAEGGKLVLAENALALPDLAAAGEVVLIDTVPSAMAELLRLGNLPATVRTVNLGGEALKGSLVREIYRQLPSVERVINLYGPSEDTTFSTWSVVPRDARHPLIGRPLTGGSAYVLAAEMAPVPLGIPGALYLGGEGLSRGYLGRPDLTAERFVPNPFGPPGSRLYQVGDLVRFRPTGELDFLGRLDHQVKVRGFRIELGEIESGLARHPAVREAAVLALPEDAGGNRLVAWVETDRDAALAAELRSFLKGALPDYMVPSLFVLLREMPRTQNGKVDRRALAAMPVQPESGGEAGRAPRNYVEEVLIAIWSEVFDQPVGVGDSFFDLGGHSLLAIRVVSRIRSILNVELPLQQMFATPTVEGLAAQVESEMAHRRGVSLPPIERASRDRELPLSFAQQRLWFLDRLQPGTATFNLPAPLRLSGSLDVAALGRALEEIVRRHESLRTRFGEREGRGYQEVQPPAAVPLPRIDLSALPETSREPEARKWTDLEARLPFDLARGPLLRTTLIELGPGEFLLLVTLHHIVTDGWSSELFARELRELHSAFAAGLPSPLSEPPLQYPDFAVWQRGTLDGETLKALLADWKQRFGTDVPPLRLPTDRPRPALQTYPGAVLSLRLSEDLTRDLHRLARRSGATLFMTMIGAFQALLHRYSGQERIVVGSPVAGRSRPELEGMIGFFVNTLVLPGDVSGNLTFRQLLERSRDLALGAYAFEDLPFEKLVEALQPVRDNSRSPLFQAMFLLQQHVREAPDAKDGEGSLRVEPSGAGTGTSQFDLTLFAAEEAVGMLVGVEYNTDLFDAATMDRMLEHYRGLLASAVANPEIRLADLPVPPLTHTPQVLMGAAPSAPKPEAKADARRDRLSSRLSKLSPAQLEALERRMKGTSETVETPAPAVRSLVEIVPGHPGTQRRPFFCIHPAGGDVLCFFPLARLIGSDQPFYGLQARGLEDTADPFASLEAMAAHYAQEIRSVQPSGPYRIGGWSFGGLAAFELAQQLRAAGEEVELLVVMDTAPGVEDDGGEASMEPAGASGDDTGLLLTIAEYIKGLRGKDLAVTAADLRPLDREAQLHFFVERLRRAGIVHSGDSLEQLRRLLRVYKTNILAYRSYVPRSYTGPITLIRAEEASFPPELGADLGWDKLTPHPIDRQHVPGDHITLLAEPYVRTLADRLRIRLSGSERS
jgi:amino acid adenylation domain-containing protein